MFDKIYKCEHCKGCHGHGIIDCPYNSITSLGLKMADERAYWRGYHDAKEQESRGYYPRTKSEEELIEMMDKATRPIEDLRRDLGI